jgi:hypothetical protein
MMLAVLLALLLICNSTFAACPTGYTETAVTGESNICLQFVYQATTTSQSAFNTLCSTSYNGGYLVVQSTVNQRTATANFAKTGCASTTSCYSGSGDRNIWIGVQCSGAASTATQVIYSPSTGLGWATNTAVTSLFTPASLTYWAGTTEPDAGETQVRLIITGTGTSSASYSISGWRGILSTTNYNYGIWYDIFTCYEYHFFITNY